MTAEPAVVEGAGRRAEALSHTNRRRCFGTAIALWALIVAGVLADSAYGWVRPAFVAIAHLFYEKPALAALRLASQVPLAGTHLAILSALVATGVGLRPWIGGPAWRAWIVFSVGYAIRATIWICGGNLPLVPGDSCHYVEVATSIVRGEGPVRHYVDSFFIDYPAIRDGRGALDDWATPLYSSLLALAYRILGVVPGQSLEATFGVAKGVSFVLNLATLPALYAIARRWYDRGVALGAMGLLAVLPVHAIYAGFALRESLTALTSLLAAWSLTEVWSGAGTSRARWAWSVVSGILAASAVLSRHTALALLGAAALHGIYWHGRRVLGPLLVWAFVLGAVLAPWAWATFREYGQPFYTYTNFFQYNFSWAVHHYQKGNTRASEFYTWANLPQIVRVKFKSLLIIVVNSTMILGLPVVLAGLRRLRWPDGPREPRSRDADRLVAAIALTFPLATLANIADVTQVAQLGRYYLPVFVLGLPVAVAGLRAWRDSLAISARAVPPLAATLVALLWADPTWAYDATWLVKPYQLHWPALREAGDWVKRHPEAVAPDARILTWYPWEFRVASDRTTVLFPRNYDARRVLEVIRQYRVTHLLWGSFETPPNVDPESWAQRLGTLRYAVGLSDDRELFRSSPRSPYPVRLYRLPQGP